LNMSSKKLLMLGLLLFGGMLVSTEMHSQQKPTASLSGAGLLQLPTNVTLSSAYEFSLASLGFQNQDQAVQFFATKTFEDFAIRPNMNTGKGVLMLDLKKYPTWTVAQWNALLNSATAAQPIAN